MKKRFVTFMFGILCVGTLSSSGSQGMIWFENYNNVNPNTPGTYGSPIFFNASIDDLGGQPIPAGFTVDLYYSFGTVTDPNAGIPTAPGVGTLLMSRFTVGYGYINSVIAFVPDYVSGPVTVQYVAHGDVDGYGSFYGRSPLLTVPSITVVSGTGFPTYLDGMQSFTVVHVPEPSIIALGTLSIGALLILRRCKRAPVCRCS
jgi:hypothetical protein